MMQEFEYEYAQFIYYTPGDLDREGQLWPVRAGRSIAKPNYKVGPKRIECYSLHVVLDGRVRLEYDGRSAVLQQGDLFCLFPGRTYYYDLLPSDTTLRLCWLALDGERVKTLLGLSGLTPERPYREGMVTSQVQESVERVIQALAEVERWNPAAALTLQGLIHAMFATFPLEPAAGYTDGPSGWIHECMDFMALHAAEGISVQQVAAFAGMHRSYFSHMFARQVGMSPLQYLQKIRMEKARRLLKGTNATITEIALSLGYPNLYTFTRAFKTYYKVPPITMRAAAEQPDEGVEAP